MPSDSDLLFHVPFSSESVDETNKIIRGVSLMTGDLEAEGHDLHVDDTTLAQIHEWGKKRGKVTVKADHKGADGKTFKAIVGYLTNFRMDTASKKVRGDLELLHSEPLTPKILEMAKKMPENFGLSAAFKGKGVKGAGGKNFARCSKLLAVDLVENPAANPDGLFSAKVDSGKNGMPNDTDPNAPTETVPAWAQSLLQKVDALTERQDSFEKQIAEQLQQVDEPSLDELAVMTDEQLDQAGFDVAKVRAAVDDAVASGEMNAPEGYTAPGGDEGAGAAAGAAAGTGAALSAKAIQGMIQLEIGKVRKQAREAAEQAEAEQAFAVIEEKVTALAAKNDELETELAAARAENKTLKFAVKTGRVNAVAPGTESTHLFSEKAPDGSFEKLVSLKTADLKKADPKLTELQAQSKAISFCVSRHRAAYAEYRERGGKIELAAK